MDSNKMTSEDFLLWEQASRDTIDLKRIYVDIAGDLVTGVLLSQILFWNLPNKEGKTKLRVWYDDKLWLAKGRNDWWEECRITAKQFDRSIVILEDRGIVQTTLKKFNGSPMKHIYLNLTNFLKIMAKTLKEQTEGKMDIAQKVKSELPKGEEENLLLRNMDLYQKGKSLTERTSERTTKTTTHKGTRVDNFNNFEQRPFDSSIENKLLGWDKYVDND